MRNILEHIKLTGVGTNANCLWTKNKYETFKQKYLEKFSDNNGVELTYHPLYFICGNVARDKLVLLRRVKATAAIKLII